MQNAKRYNQRITIGLVPGSDDLAQLKELGYKTLVDMRDIEEKFGGLVQKRAADLGFNYINIPIDRDQIQMESLDKFYRVVFGETEEPMYIFSRFGKKPLAFLLLFEAVVNGDPLQRVFHRARRFGLGGLDGDLALQSFVVDAINSGRFNLIVESIMKSQPDLFDKYTESKEQIESRRGNEGDDLNRRILALLSDATGDWERTKDKTTLREKLRILLETLAR